MRAICKYKVGDKVKIKSLDWYNKNKNKALRECVDCGNRMFTPQMSKWCGMVVTIVHIENDCYMDENAWYWTDEMIECLVETLT